MYDLLYVIRTTTKMIAPSIKRKQQQQQKGDKSAHRRYKN